LQLRLLLQRPLPLAWAAEVVAAAEVPAQQPLADRVQEMPGRHRVGTDIRTRPKILRRRRKGKRGPISPFNEARRIAANIAKLPHLLRRRSAERAV
jgi:hypothetical protein